VYKIVSLLGKKACQDATHTKKKNQKVLALINRNESETESDLDDSDYNKTYDPSEK